MIYKERVGYDTSKKESEKEGEKIHLVTWPDAKLVTPNADHVFLGHGLTSVQLDLQSIKNNVPEEFYNSLDISFRSRLAQRGIDAIGNAGFAIRRSLQEDNFSNVVNISLCNYSNRAYVMKEGMGIGGLYSWNGGFIQGTELEQLFRENKICIEGERDSTWWPIISEVDGKQTLIGVELSIDIHGARSLSSKKEPLYVNENGNSLDFRKEIDEELEELRASEMPSVWIGQTSDSLSLPDGVSAILSPYVARRDGDSLQVLKDSRHLNARLIYGAKWPIRTEILGPTSKDRIANSIAMFFLNTKQ